ncbi:hypothetical protein [Streptomyces sp. NPDC029674]|uniref:hypothetical protein n=1 Tax=Streptomyces sp. NPDC029674 TaxID=3365297 RepID=UPI00384BEFD7
MADHAGVPAAGRAADRAGDRAGAGGRWLRGAALCVAVSAAAGGLTSCGTEREVAYSGGTLEKVVPADEARGKELTVEALGLLRGADSVRIGVDMPTPKGRQKVSLHMDRDNNCTGTFDAGPTQRGDLIMIGGGATYVRFSDESLRAIRELAASRGPEVAARTQERTALARGKYLKIPTGVTGGSPSPVNSCDLDKITREMPGTTGVDTVVKALPETRRYGRAVTPLIEHKDGSETSVYVAAEGRPYVLGVETEKSGQKLSMRLSAYDEPVTAVAPAAAQTIDISEIRPGGGGLFEV